MCGGLFKHCTEWIKCLQDTLRKDDIRMSESNRKRKIRKKKERGKGNHSVQWDEKLQKYVKIYYNNMELGISTGNSLCAKTAGLSMSGLELTTLWSMGRARVEGRRGCRGTASWGDILGAVPPSWARVINTVLAGTVASAGGVGLQLQWQPNKRKAH